MKHNLEKSVKDRAMHRVKIIRGQIEGLLKSVEKDEYCPTILKQSLAIQMSLRSLDELMLKNHLKVHVKHQMQKAGEDDKAVEELIEIYHLANR
jgi:CsoR family transcriptional regulator, copper-sensing transcriptional repressor